MKFILTVIFSFVFLVSGFSQTRNVVVGTNDVIVQPTNFWSANASNGRTGLGLGSAATNPASIFQPSSSVLSNLASSNGASLTNISVSNVVGALSTNGNAFGLTNINASNITGTIAISNGGTGATNAAGARTNLGLEWSALTNTNAATSLLGFTTNGQVVANTTNTLSVTNLINFAGIVEVSSGVQIYGPTPITFDDLEAAELTRLGLGFSTNLNTLWTATNASNARSAVGLGWSALTNTNAGTGLVSVNTNGEVVSPTNFWQVSPANTRVQLSQPVVNATNSATNARNLYLYSLAISTAGVTNTIQLPTNGGTLLGDVATIIHEGPTNSVTAVRQTGAGSNIITLNQFQEAVKFIYESAGWRLADNISYVEPIYFSGTNAAANAAESRTNLGLGATNNVVFGQGTETNVGIGVGSTNVGLASGGAIIQGRLGLIEGGNIVAVLDGDASPFFGLYRPITFQGTNATSNAETTRTNLGLGFSALTNTNAAGFQRAIFTTNAAPTNSANVNTVNFNTAVAWIEISVVTNSVTNSYRIPVFQ